MTSKTVREEFERYLRGGGDASLPRTPRAGIQKMVDFYRQVRADDVDLEADGDMLLFQWGTYDSGGSALFEVDVTRQLLRGTGEDDEIGQLHLTYRFAPSGLLAALGKGDRWCARPSDVESFVQFMMTHPAVAAVGARDDGHVRLDLERAG